MQAPSHVLKYFLGITGHIQSDTDRATLRGAQMLRSLETGGTESALASIVESACGNGAASLDRARMDMRIDVLLLLFMAMNPTNELHRRIDRALVGSVMNIIYDFDMIVPSDTSMAVSDYMDARFNPQLRIAIENAVSINSTALRRFVGRYARAAHHDHFANDRHPPTLLARDIVSIGGNPSDFSLYE